MTTMTVHLMLFKIETLRLCLRPFEKTDASIVQLLQSQPDVVRFLGAADPTLEAALETIEAVQEEYASVGYGRLMVTTKADARPIGWSFLKKRTTEKGVVADLGYRFLPEYWGRGFAFEAAYASAYVAFKGLHFPKLGACADVNNTASGRILEKIGFEKKHLVSVYGRPHHYFELAATQFQPLSESKPPVWTTY